MHYLVLIMFLCFLNRNINISEYKNFRRFLSNIDSYRNIIEFSQFLKKKRIQKNLQEGLSPLNFNFNF